MNYTNTNNLIAQLRSPIETEIYSSLENINNNIQYIWAEISEELPLIVRLIQSTNPKIINLSHIVISKCFFYLGDYKSASEHCLEGGEYINLDKPRNDYEKKMVFTLINNYIELRKLDKEIPIKLNSIVDSFFENSLNGDNKEEVIGIAIESRRIDIIQKIIENTIRPVELINKIKEILDKINVDYKFKTQLLELFTKEAMKNPETGNIESMTDLWLGIKDVDGLVKLLNTMPEDVAAQILLDYEGISQKFRIELEKKLPENLKKFINYEIRNDIYCNFLFSKNKTDNLLLNYVKTNKCFRSKIIQNALIFANSFMHSGTSNIMFLKENTEWVADSSNWAKFSTTASLGVIFKGSENKAMKILSPYAANGQAGKSVYAQAGRLYALGLIFAGHGDSIIEHLKEQLNKSITSNDEVLKHGASIGIGLAGISTEDEEIYELLKQILYGGNSENEDVSSATSGMAAGIAIGLIMMGTGKEDVINDLLQQCLLSEHNKIVRGIGIGLSLVMYGLQEKADTLILTMLTENNSVIRYGGIHVLGLSYIGTGNEEAIKKLLHYSVTDPSDEVKRAAIMMLGFVLCNNPEKLIKIITMIIDSYNPHIRYGCAIALGIACVGTNNEEAIKIMKPLLMDPTDYVKQGADIAMAMILMETSVSENKEVETFMNLMKENLKKQEGLLSYYGNVISLGILNAGGRNCTISLHNNLGGLNMNTIAGLVISMQYWYWYPFLLTMSMSFTPTTIIGVDSKLNVINKFKYISNAKPSQFDYLPMTQPTQKKEQAKMKQTTLSYSMKTKTDTSLTKSLNVSTNNLNIKEKEESKMEVEETKEQKEEPTFVVLENASRVTQRQLSVIKMEEDSKYYTTTKFPKMGFVLLQSIEGEMEIEEEVSNNILLDEHKPINDNNNNNTEKLEQALLSETKME